ncbi:putative secreted protein [Rosellinia necatrix]|uniref:Putative secreted protein n=1 Tax=Rosellinia necatrix TaxID=77044 RepID=A0A1W2TJR9_ROSNE|nr:putative secreted protein [Rosellinia necatrix]
MPSQRSFVAAGLALLMASTANALPFSLVARDPPQALPQKATANDLKFQPAMDFDTDGCYNTPAIGPDGTINPGLDNKNTGLSSGCRDLSDLQNNNVYARARCNNGWCAYVYDYYFEKDVVLANVPFDFGHRNDWEHIVVWAQNGEAKFVAASAHGEYEIKAASDVRWEGTHPKMVYHKDGLGSHAFRFGNADDDSIENHTGKWFYGALVSWNGFPTTALRDKLSAYDFGSANFALKDGSFPGNLEGSRSASITGFDINKDDGSPGNP